MSELVADCPRCAAKRITFDLSGSGVIALQYGWQRKVEAFATCRHCARSTILIVEQEESHGIADGAFRDGIHNYKGSIGSFARTIGFVNLKDLASSAPPDHLPPSIDAAFREGATCLGVGCFNAAASMFRLCIDLATKGLLPSEGEPNARIRRSLGHRLEWLFANDYLPPSLRDLSAAVKEDGNDGAHDGTLTKVDADDLLDFTEALLERLFTEPAKIQQAQERRDKRRNLGS